MDVVHGPPRENSSMREFLTEVKLRNFVEEPSLNPEGEMREVSAAEIQDVDLLIVIMKMILKVLHTSQLPSLLMMNLFGSTAISSLGNLPSKTDKIVFNLSTALLQTSRLLIAPNSIVPQPVMSTSSVTGTVLLHPPPTTALLAETEEEPPPGLLLPPPTPEQEAEEEDAEVEEEVSKKSLNASQSDLLSSEIFDYFPKYY